MKSDISAEEVFRQLADSLALNDSPDFFPQLMRCLSEVLNVEHALVAEVFPEQGEARTLAVWSRGQPLDNFTYPLAGTPCETALGANPCAYPEKVCALFPDDQLLKNLGVQGYFGFPMFARDDSPLGLIALLSDDPLDLPPAAEEALRMAAAQAGAELGRRRAELSLLESERRLHTLMNHLPGMAYRCRNDADWTMEFVSQGALTLTGYSPSELKGSRKVAFAQLIHPADRVRVDVDVQASLAASKPYRIIYRLINAQGDVRWVWEQGQAVPSPDRSEVLLEGFISDITEQHESERVQEAVVQTATAITSRLGADYFQQLVLHLTRALDADVGFVATLQGEDEMQTLARVIAGLPAENVHYKVTGSHCAEVLSQGESVGRFEPPITLPRPGGAPLTAHSYVGRRLDSADGEPIGTIMVLYSHPAPDLKLATSVLRILAAGAAAELERQKNDQRIYQLAYVDGTTALPNRVHFMERLDTELARAASAGESLGLVFLDLKRFKEINDVLGHNTGDQLLTAVAQRLEQACKLDEFLARLSGDEFALLVPNPGPDELSAVIERCHQSLIRPVYAAGREFALDANIGAARYPMDATSAADLFQCASVAMHEAKRTDGNTCIFDVAIAEALNRRRALAERFALALAENRLSLHYQPQIDLVTGSLVGAEVLCRWQDSQWGWVSPAEFIPQAEERGLISELGCWVLRSASRQWLEWQAQGHPLPGRLSVNISALQFNDLALADELEKLAAPASARVIGVELTESGFMRDPELAVKITERLRRAGFGLSIDDFGTGYSSLSYLRRFAADTLKIDMSFVRDMLDNQNDYTIVTTIVAMAHSLGMMTVAEGVENQAQADALAKLGCDRAQGFLYDRPLDSQRFAARWLTPE